MRTDVEAQCYERRTHTLWYQYRLHWWQNRAEIPTRHERCIERWCQTRIRGTGYSITAYKSFRIDVPIVGKTSLCYSFVYREIISLSLSLSLSVSVQFVQSCSCKLLLWWFNKDLRILKKIVRKKEPVMFSRLIVLLLFRLIFLLLFFIIRRQVNFMLF